MKITKSQLRKIIKEELRRVMEAKVKNKKSGAVYDVKKFNPERQEELGKGAAPHAKSKSEPIDIDSTYYKVSKEMKKNMSTPMASESDKEKMYQLGRKTAGEYVDKYGGGKKFFDIVDDFESSANFNPDGGLAAAYAEGLGNPATTKKAPKKVAKKNIRASEEDEDEGDTSPWTLYSGEDEDEDEGTMSLSDLDAELEKVRTQNRRKQ